MSSLKWIWTSIFLTLTAHAGSWRDHRADIFALNADIEGQELVIREKLREKRENTDARQLAKILKEMTELHRDLKSMASQRNEILKHMRFRHPERGQDFDSQYFKIYEVRSLSEFEEELGLSGSLDRMKEKVELHYGVRPEDRTELSPQRRKEEEKKERSQRIRLTK